VREFFKGWRRKFGCITLVTACVFAVGWVRGYCVEDQLWLGLSGRGNVWDRLFSSRRGIGLIRWESKSLSTYFTWSPGWITKVLDENCDFLGDLAETYPESTIQWRRGSAGFDIGSTSHQAKNISTFFIVVPYWSVVFPLTLLSACFLFSEPKRRVTKQTTEPAPTIGA
jgi:hypothetical protein